MSRRARSPTRHTIFPSILSMLEHMDLSQKDRQSGSVFVESRIEAQCLIFLTSNHKKILLLPDPLVRHTPKTEMKKLLQARWHEHVAESHLLDPCGQQEGQQLQLSLLKHRQERAELEVSLYSAARTPFLTQDVVPPADPIESCGFHDVEAKGD